MTRFPAIFMLVAFCAPANTQPATSTLQTAPASHQQTPRFDRTELLRRSGVLEDAIRKAELAHDSNARIARLYGILGEVYENLGWYAKAEADMRKATSLLINGPQDQLAELLEHLAFLHVAMGEDRQAEKDDLQALRIRETLPDPIGLAIAWNDLADLYYRERHYRKALDYAQHAMTVVANNPKASADFRIAVRQTLGYALCGDGHCTKAIPILKDALELARATFGPDSLEGGIASYDLGFALWHSGNTADAAQWLKAGIERMKVEFGWGHELYINALRQYSLFLHQNRQREEAAAVDREMQMLTATVDVHTLANQNGQVSALGLR